MSKIAVATNDGKTVASHVGRARSFAIYWIENGAAKYERALSNTFTQHFGGGHGQGSGQGQGRGMGMGSGRQGQGAEAAVMEEHHGSHGGLIAALKEAGCDALICRGMGPRMVEDLNHYGMVPIVCGEELVEEAASHYAQGDLAQGESACEHGA